jgi:hypothetical protein
MIAVLVLGESLSTELLRLVHFLLVVDQVNQELVQLHRIQAINLFVEVLVERLVLHLVLLLRVDRRGAWSFLTVRANTRDVLHQKLRLEWIQIWIVAGIGHDLLE